MRRVLAVVAAAAMVAGSLAVRSRLDRTSTERSQVLRLTCTTELTAACTTLAHDDTRVRLTVEPAGTTADRLATADGDLGLDGWLTTAPWPDIVDLERGGHSLGRLFPATKPTLARSPLVVAVWKDRAAVLGATCKGPVGWRCLGEAAGAGGWSAIGGRPEWGDVKVGLAPPVSDGVGLAVLGQAVGSWFGRPDVSTGDLDDDAFKTWFAGLVRAVPPSAASPIETMLATGPAAFDAAGAVEAEAGPLLATAARGKQVDLLYPSPMATADVVLATPAVDAAGSSASLRGVAAGSAARKALAGSGWRVDGQPRSQGVPDTPGLPATAGLPSPGLLDALRARWHEVTGR
ncbi:MAG: hypothetical protein V7605_1260 [Acidimicrobiaceae bacterium]|jgi:hypothetical protein